MKWWDPMIPRSDCPCLIFNPLADLAHIIDDSIELKHHQYARCCWQFVTAVMVRCLSFLLMWLWLVCCRMVLMEKENRSLVDLRAVLRMCTCTAVHQVSPLFYDAVNVTELSVWVTPVTVCILAKALIMHHFTVSKIKMGGSTGNTVENSSVFSIIWMY